METIDIEKLTRGKTVLTTTDYNEFNYYAGNRPVHKRAARLGELMIKTRGNVQAVLVTPTKFVVDGQHRIAGCKMFSLPVHYIILDVTDKEALDLMMNINTEQKSWTDFDRMHFNATQGIAGYQFYLDLMAKKSDLSLIMALGRIDRKTINEQLPLAIQPRVTDKLELVRSLAAQHRAMIGEAPRLREFMRGLNTLEDKAAKLRAQGVTVSTRLSYGAIKKNFMKVSDTYGVQDNATSIARNMSKAMDYKKLKENRLELF